MVVLKQRKPNRKASSKFKLSNFDLEMHRKTMKSTCPPQKYIQNSTVWHDSQKERCKYKITPPPQPVCRILNLLPSHPVFSQHPSLQKEKIPSGFRLFWRLVWRNGTILQGIQGRCWNSPMVTTHPHHAIFI